MKSKIIVSFANKTPKEIEDRLFWVVFEAERKFGKDRIKAEMDFVFDKQTCEVTFSSDGEINTFVSNYILERNADGTEWGEKPFSAADFTA